ncbi:MAG: tyrosine-type recombinase/integrase [Candidatus Pacebacteria bacterium]|nr:tyrosine-type recombinase/integrase [Candidatus Paceibacterota bacterium]
MHFSTFPTSCRKKKLELTRQRNYRSKAAPIIHLKQAKGQKNRVSILPAESVDSFKKLIAGKADKDFVFESETGGKSTTRTAQKLFENSLEKTGIKKKATFRSLWYSFANHLLKNGVDVRYVQGIARPAKHQNVPAICKGKINPSFANIKRPL